VLELTRAECLDLLAATQIGRVVVMTPNTRAPVIRLVNYIFDAVTHTGWSVIIAGASQEVTSGADIRRLSAGGPQPWAPLERAHWVRIKARTVTGRRIAV